MVQRTPEGQSPFSQNPPTFPESLSAGITSSTVDSFARRILLFAEIPRPKSLGPLTLVPETLATMNTPVLENETAELPSRSVKPAGESSDLSALEKRLTERLDSRMDEIKKSVTDGLVKLQERVVPLIDERVSKAHSGSFATLTNTTKEALANVVQAILFDSGILERLVTRIVDEKITSRGAAPSSTAAAGLNDEARKEIAALAQKAITATLAGEQMKMLLDDKFRAITLYLKSEVIPKAVQDILKAKG